MAEAHCTAEGCDDNAGRGFANEGALRIHGVAKHGLGAGDCTMPGCDNNKGEGFKNLAMHMAKGHRAPPVVEPPPVTAPFDDEEPLPFAETPPLLPPGVEAASDGAPTSGRPRLRDRVKDKVSGAAWGGKQDGGGTYGEPPKTKTRKARSSTSALLAMAWGGGGSLLIRSGADVPVGRVLQLQAPMAGEILDKLVARTWVDRLLQPLAAKTDEMEALGALVLLPIVVAAAERSPEGQALVPIMRQLVEANLVALAPVVKKQKADAAKFAAAVKDLDLGMPEGMDPVEAILGSIFAPPPNAEPPPAQPMPQANAPADAFPG